MHMKAGRVVARGVRAQVAALMSRPVVACLLAATLCTRLAVAGDLASFEKAATRQGDDGNRKRGASQQDGARSSDSCDRSFSCQLVGALVEPVFKLAFLPFALMGSSSLERQSGEKADKPGGLRKREKHDRDIPNLALDFNYQRAEGDIDGVESRVEIGWAPVGLQVKNIHYRQDDPAAALDFTHVHALWRGSFAVGQINLGLGKLMLDGQDYHSGSSSLVQISAFPTRHLAVDVSGIFSDINDNDIAEYDGSVAFGNGRGHALRAGYKVQKTSGETLHGPYLGLSWRY
jgi:hypothetical protein